MRLFHSFAVFLIVSTVLFIPFDDTRAQDAVSSTSFTGETETASSSVIPAAVPESSPQPVPQTLVTPSVPKSAVDGVALLGNFLGLGNTDPRMIVASLVKVALGFLGIIFLIMILLSGFTFMTAGGDSERAGAAKRTFFNAIIGLIIILSANSIVLYVLRAFTDQTTIGLPSQTETIPAESDL